MALWSQLRAFGGMALSDLQPSLPNKVRPRQTPIFEITPLEQRIVFGPAHGFWSAYDGFTSPLPLTPSDTSPLTPDPSGSTNPDTSNTSPSNNHKCCCCNGNHSSYIDLGNITEPTPAATTGDPIRLFDGFPQLASADLQSAGLGSGFGVTRSWTGLNESGPVGNGWTVAELPYLVVGGSTQFFSSGVEQSSGDAGSADDYVSLVEGGTAAFTFTIPDPNSLNSSIYTNLTPRGTEPLQLKALNGTMQLTDAAGNVLTFSDVYRQPDINGQQRPAPLNNPAASGITASGSSYGQFKSFTGTNGITVTANTVNPGQSNQQLILTRQDSTSGAQERYVYQYGTVSNSLGGSALLVTSVQFQQWITSSSQWVAVRTAAYTYYQGDGRDTAGNTVNTADGRLGDLELVTVTDSGSNVLSRAYYRYYKLTGTSNNVSSIGPTNNPQTTGGGPPLQPAWSNQAPYSSGATNSNNPYADVQVSSGLKMVVEGPSFDRMAAAFPSNPAGYLTATDASLVQYANDYFKYERWGDIAGADGYSGNLNTSGAPTDDPTQGFGAAGYNGDDSIRWRTHDHDNTRYRVVEEITQAGGSSTVGGGSGVTKYEYAANYSGPNQINGLSAYGYDVTDYNTWAMKTTEYLSQDSPTPSGIFASPTQDTTANWANHDRLVTYTNEVGQPLLEDQVSVSKSVEQVTAMSVVGNTVTVDTVDAQPFAVGDVVAITGVLPQLYNGVFTVTAVNQGSFSFQLPTAYYVSGEGLDAPIPYVNTTTPQPGPVTLLAGGAAKVTGQRLTYYRYDDSGRLIQVAHPSSVAGYDDSESTGAWLATVSGSNGLLDVYQYAGWNFDGRAGITANAPGGNDVLVANSPQNPYASQAAFLLSSLNNHETDSVISQTVYVPTAGSYNLSFYAGQGSGSTQALAVYLDGLSQPVSYNNSTAAPSIDFTQFPTGYHLAQASSISLSAGFHVLQFVASGTSGTALLAHVNLSPTGGANLAQDSDFADLSLPSASYQYNPTNYAIPASGNLPAAVAGYMQARFQQQGQNGTSIQVESVAYTSHVAAGTTVFLQSQRTTYGAVDPSTFAVSDPRTTSETYTSYFPNTNIVQTETITDPPIPTGQNGPGTSDTITEVFDKLGNMIWQKDGGGYISYNQYDPLTGALVKHIDDVDTTKSSDFLNLPSGWNTPAGGGAELITSYEFDNLGRTTKVIDPANQGASNLYVTRTVYNDGHAAGAGGFVNEVRVYPGWHQIGTSGTYTTTGPIQISREYRPGPGAPAGQQTVYDETLTISAPIENTIDPSGTETVDATTIQSLSRDITNNGGQVIEHDDYSSLAGLQYSPATAYLAGAVQGDNTRSGNFSATIYGYDGQGRQDKVQDPNGTINRTFYDDFGQIASRWVGTSDTRTDTSHDWSPTNNSGNMKDVEDYVYDQPASQVPVTLSQVLGGAMGATTYYVKLRFIVAGQETTSSQESTISVAAGHLLSVTSPSAIPGATAYDVYVSNAAGQELLQNATPISIGTNWTEPSLGLVPQTRAVPGAQLSASTGGTVSSQQVVYVEVTLVGPNGESVPSPEQSILLNGYQTAVVTPVNSLWNATGYNVYASTTSRQEVLQTTSGPLGFQSTLRLDPGALVSGIAPPPAPSYTTTTGGNLGDQYITVRTTYVTANGESLASESVQATVSAGNLLVVNAPPTVPGATGYDVYVDTASGETRENNSPIPLNQTWQEGSLGLGTVGYPILQLAGDSNLTETLQHPGGGAADRVTLNLYDARDRLIATKAGALLNPDGTYNLAGETADKQHRLITYYQLDNLGETTGTYVYAADGVNLADFATWSSSSSWQHAANLRAYTGQSFDDQGRVYQSIQYSVDPNSGAYTTTGLASNTFYDQRGNVIEEIAPGGQATKHVYDGAGRDIQDFVTDGGVLNSPGTAGTWAAAGSVANDVVLTQTDTTYDKNGNVTLTTTRDRFHGDAQTGVGSTGPLGYASGDYTSAAAGYSFFEHSGTTTADGSGNGNTGTLNGGVTWSTSGPTGNALTFDGSTGYLDLGNSATLNFIGQITISAWVQPNDQAPSGTEIIAGHYSSSEQQGPFMELASGSYKVGGWTGGTGPLASFAIPAGDVGHWVHLVGEYDGASWKLYRNGVLVASATSSIASMQTNVDWMLGSSLNGSLADVRILNRALTDQEVAALYSFAPAARVSYAASYYDGADRLTDTVNLGTNGGIPIATVPSLSSLPPGSLHSTYGYAADNVQTVTVGANAASGTFTLSFGSGTTAAIAYNATAATVQSDLAALASIGAGNVSVTGPAGGPYLVRFIGQLAGTFEPLLGTTSSVLDGGGHAVAVSAVITVPGGDAGRQQSVTDPRGITSFSDFDLAGRTLRTISAFTTGAPSPVNPALDNTTAYVHDANGDAIQMIAVQPPDGTSASQTTQYVYGVTGSIFSNDLVSEIDYPDKVTGLAATIASEKQTFAYNLVGEKTSFTDQNGTTHGYNYDVLGRLTADIITTLGSGVDGSVRYLGYSFDAAGRPYQQTSYSDVGGTTIVNQVQDAYNGYGQIITEYQAHSGVVNTGGGAPTLSVGYGYSQSTPNASRLIGMTYPNARFENYQYQTALDNAISRIDVIGDAGGTDTGRTRIYQFLGLSNAVTFDGNNVTLTYVKQAGDTHANTDGGDQYTGLDRFGRVIDQYWTGPGSSTVDRFQYGYDANGNVLYKNNLINANFSELYHVNGSGGGYDSLNRLTAFQRGTLNSSLDTITTPNTLAGSSNNWSLDAVGNITSSGGVAHTVNSENQVTAVGSAGLTYDNNGNMLTDEKGNTYTYDAWNRIATVNGTNRYKYDAQGRRTYEGTTGHDLYYNTAGNVVEERSGSTVTDQEVWGLGYVNDLVLRDDNSVGGSLGKTASGLGRRLWAIQDANWNVTSLANDAGSVALRFVYDPYGTKTVLNASWAPATDPTNMLYGFQDGRTDPISGKVNFQNRDLNTGTSTWMEADPAGYAGGYNLYQFGANDPTCVVDPSGLMATVPGKGFSLFGFGVFGATATAKSFIARIGSRHGFSALWPVGIGMAKLTDRMYSENPATPAMIKDYRIFSSVTFSFTCSCSRIHLLGTSPRSDAGKEGPLNGVDAGIQGLIVNRTSPSTISYQWTELGAPNPAAWASFWFAQPRSATFIGHKVWGQLQCKDGFGTISGDIAGSAFPTHRLWLNTTAVATKWQGAFSTLWSSRPGQPFLVN